MNEIEIIKKKLNEVKVSAGQIDPNGLCNVKCWYCPVSEFGNPKQYIHQMPLNKLEYILKEIRNSNVISKGFTTIFPFHYNEVLLYKDFEGLLNLFRKYKIISSIATNGTTLTPEKTDLILSNKDVLGKVECNCPSIDEENWKKLTGMNSNLFKRLIKNLDYFHENCNEGDLRISLNNVNERTKFCSVMENGIKSDFYDLLEMEFRIKEKYPKFEVVLNSYLVDRGGILKEKNKLQSHVKDWPVNNCDYFGTSRALEWFHINSLGDMFLCCNDFHMEYKFGNIFEQSFDEIWLSDKHAEIIHKAYNSICKNCYGGEYIINEKI